MNWSMLAIVMTAVGVLLLLAALLIALS